MKHRQTSAPPFARRLRLLAVLGMAAAGAFPLSVSAAKETAFTPDTRLSSRILPETEEETQTETTVPETETEKKAPDRSDPLLTPREIAARQTDLLRYDFSGVFPSFADLWDTLLAELSEAPGTWSLYLKDLTCGRTLSINDGPQSSASLIKLYICGAVLEKLEERYPLAEIYSDHTDIEEIRDVKELLTSMITVSSNDAANELTRWLDPDGEKDHRAGLAAVNAFIRRHGFSDTHQYNGLDDQELWYTPALLNRTSASDCAAFLEQVYQGTLVSHQASRYMEELLMQQQLLNKIPAGLPEGTLSASKTGETDDTENDAAIVYSAGGDYILCILSTGLADRDAAVETIRRLSAAVCACFNP